MLEPRNLMPCFNTCLLKSRKKNPEKYCFAKTAKLNSNKVGEMSRLIHDPDSNAQGTNPVF